MPDVENDGTIEEQGIEAFEPEPDPEATVAFDLEATQAFIPGIDDDDALDAEGDLSDIDLDAFAAELLAGAEPPDGEPLDGEPPDDQEADSLQGAVVTPSLGRHGADNISRREESAAQQKTKRQLNALLWIGIALILVALGIAGYLLWRHFSAASGYARLRDMADLDMSALEDPAHDAADGGLNIDWDGLKAINPDIVAWLYVPGTRLSYPVVRGRDNSYYLNHTADGAVNASGAIFLDYENSADFTDMSNYVYGHNMLGNAMFSEMTKYIDEQFLREHPRILILMPDRTLDLTVVGAIKCSGTDPVRRISFSSDQDFYDFRGVLGSYLVSGQYAKLMDAGNLYCFSTCELFDLGSRIIVIATDNNRGSETGYAPPSLPRAFTAPPTAPPPAVCVKTSDIAAFLLLTPRSRR